jgi:DNA-binding transcriptional MerR regulator
MVRKKEKPVGIRIGQLSELTGVSRDTIKFYLREGLIPRPFKTGSTMSYYDPSCVERIALIKKMQSERFLPLQVIRDMLEDEGSAVEELALAEAFMGMSAFSDPVTVLSIEEIQQKTGYSLQEIEKVQKAGMIGPRRDEPGREFTSIDLQILSLIRRREQAGFSLDYSLLMMGIYRDAIGTIVREGTQLFATRANIDEKLVTMVQNVGEGERALAEFMPLIRTKLKHEYFGQLNVQFQTISNRILDVFNFRSIDITDSAIDCPTLTYDLFFDEPADSLQLEHFSHLVGGIRALLSGEHGKAREVFEQYPPDGSCRAAVLPLMGLSHVMAASMSRWYLEVIRDFRIAAESLSAPTNDVTPTILRVMIDYLRGAGLAIIPDSFDTHRSAAQLLEGLRPSIDTEITKTTHKQRRAFVREVWVKSRSVLATTYLYDRNMPKARLLLEEIKKEPETLPFYHDWARQQLAQIG